MTRHRLGEFEIPFSDQVSTTEVPGPLAWERPWPGWVPDGARFGVSEREPIDQVVARLYRVEGLNLATIAEQFGRSAGWVSNRVWAWCRAPAQESHRPAT